MPLNPGLSPAVDFQAILDAAKKNPKPATSMPTISAAEFIKRNLRASGPTEQRVLIEAYTGTYNVREPHGVQLDNAVRLARNALKPVPKFIEMTPVRNVEAVSTGIVGELLRKGADLKARINCADELEYSPEVVKAMQRQFSEIEGALSSMVASR